MTLQRRIFLLRATVCGLLLLLALLPMLCAAGCAGDGPDEAVLHGRWRVVSYETDDGTAAEIGGRQMDMIFYATHVGEAQLDGTTQYMFEYRLQGNTLIRTMTYPGGSTATVRETVTYDDDTDRLTVRSPGSDTEPAATITLCRISGGNN